jgi:hypothetical protein
MLTSMKCTGKAGQVAIDLLNNPKYSADYVFKRYAAPSSAKGQAQARTEILNNGNPWTMRASIQPMKGYEMMMLPEGLRNSEVKKVYTQTVLQVASEDTQLLGDRLTIDGKTYEIKYREDWSGKALPYQKYFAAKVPKA